MTVGIAVKFDGGVVCASDTSVNFGNNRFPQPTIKGAWRAGSFILVAGEAWATDMALAHEEPDFLNAVRACAYKYREQLGKDGDHFPCEFLEIRNGVISYIEGVGSRIAPFDYAAIGTGGVMAWSNMHILYKRIRKFTETNVKRAIREVIETTDTYDCSVNRQIKYETVWGR